MNPYLAAVVENVLPPLVLIIGGLLSVLGAWVLKKLREKLGLSITSEQQKLLEGAVINGIGLAEKWALSKVKVGETAPTGAQKLDKALEFVAGATKDLGLQERARDELAKLVEAKLGLSDVEKQ